MTLTTEAQPLSVRVKEMTRRDHQEAESSRFITELMGGTRSSCDYALLVSQYHYIYEALESAAEQLREQSPVIGLRELFDPALDRREAISRDLEQLLGQSGLGPEPIQLKATERYVQRLREVAAEPARLAAHHYLRFLGDLSGGLVIAKLVQRHYGIPQSQLNMYTFSSIEKPKLYKDAYRENLDRLQLNLEHQAWFVEEANLGFALNKAVFEELAEFTAGV